MPSTITAGGRCLPHFIRATAITLTLCWSPFGWSATLPADLKWAITHIHIPDNGASLAQAIIDGTAVAVSDASYKDLFGTAALVVEGPPTSHRANAVNITPGPIKEGDSTRCETGGLIGIMVLTMAICTVHNGRKVSIRVSA